MYMEDGAPINIYTYLRMAPSISISPTSPFPSYPSLAPVLIPSNRSFDNHEPFAVFCTVSSLFGWRILVHKHPDHQPTSKDPRTAPLCAEGEKQTTRPGSSHGENPPPHRHPHRFGGSGLAFHKHTVSGNGGGVSFWERPALPWVLARSLAPSSQLLLF